MPAGVPGHGAGAERRPVAVAARRRRRPRAGGDLPAGRGPADGLERRRTGRGGPGRARRRRGVGRPGRLADVLACRPSSSPPSGCPGPGRTRRGSTRGCSRTWRAGVPARSTRSRTSCSTYYPLSPAKLRRWHPGAGVVLAGPSAAYLGLRGLPAGRRRRHRGPRPPARRPGDRLPDVRRLLAATRGRGPRSSAASACTSGRWSTGSRRRGPPRGLAAAAGHGRHRRRSSRRAAIAVHALRRVPVLHPGGAARSTRCSPTRDTQPELEQPGCLHAGMDLYKWALQADPLMPSRAGGRLLRAGPGDPRRSTCGPRRTTWPASATRRSRWRPRTAGPTTSGQRGFADSGALLRTRLIAALTSSPRSSLPPP